MKKSVKKKNGFTLAEVLITLAIIGVVAALTIPTLVMNFNEKSWDSANKVFRARFEEAMRLTNVTQGISGYATTKDFVNALSKNFKIGKICDSDELSSCFGEKFTFRDTEYETDELQASSNLGLPDWDSEVIGLMFDSGVSALITYDKNCALSDPYSNNTAELTSCVALLYDVNGNGNPNSYEQDIKAYGEITLSNTPDVLLPEEVSSYFAAGSFEWTDDSFTRFNGTGSWSAYQNCSWQGSDYTYFHCSNAMMCTKNSETSWACGNHTGGGHTGGGAN